MEAFDLAGVLRRIRRLADTSQRELAEACGLSQSAVAQAETGRRELPVSALVCAAALAGLRLALLDADGAEVRGMDGEPVRDLGGRRFPAHLDVRPSEDGWWYGPYRYDRSEVWFTFDRARWARDLVRAHRGTDADHPVPQEGDSPVARRARRQR